MAIPVIHALPEKPEDWATFTLPEELVTKAKTHEDKIMISRYAFAKPELTLYHLNNVFKLLEDHYFTIQQLPVLHLLQLFNQEVYVVASPPAIAGNRYRILPAAPVFVPASPKEPSRFATAVG